MISLSMSTYTDRPIAPNHIIPSTVLVVEDDHFTRRAICDILSLREIKTLEANTGEDCLALYKQHQKEIGLICLDQNLASRLTGMQTAVQLKQLNPQVKIVLLSGHSADELLSTDQRNIIAGYICKPFTMKHLIAEINRHLEIS